MLWTLFASLRAKLRSGDRGLHNVGVAAFAIWVHGRGRVTIRRAIGD